MIKRIICQDKYEAVKLSSLIFIKSGKETFIKEILNIIKNEVVISLKDKSAHSIILKDDQEVEIFADFIQSICEGRHRIISTIAYDEYVEIIKS
ncbi:MAG: hypothetical protein OXF28_04365 [Thaumarchaeota archaeon]|nr:hypothetical protein [Nitrososphaerota archaeon]MCY3976344.1 hypothetical protein [Nitrososphaerota archaeon]